MTRPAISVSVAAAGGLIVYASWNGATDVASWQLVAGTTPKKLTAAGTSAARTGFETEVHTRTSERYLAVRALDSSGRPLATSTTIIR